MKKKVNLSSYKIFELDPKQIEKAPHLPGCYLFYFHTVPLYVGKAQDLYKRIKSHVNSDSPRFTESNKLRIIATPNIKSAILLEQNLISFLKPKFNFLSRQSKVLYYLLVISVFSNSRQGYSYKLYYGNPGVVTPDSFSCGLFSAGFKSRQLLEVLENAFPLAKCDGRLKMPCFYFQLGRCSGWCFREVPEAYYRKQIRGIRDFFAGNVKLIEDRLKKKMEKEISQLAFERSKSTKKLLTLLEEIVAPQGIELGINVTLDYFCIRREAEKILFFLFIYRFGSLVWLDKQELVCSEKDKATLENAFFSFVNRNYHFLAPLVSVYLEVESELEEFILKSHKIRLSIPNLQRAPSSIKKYLSGEPVFSSLKLFRSPLKKEWSLEVKKLSALFGLKKLERIDCLDVSNLVGDLVSGSAVVIVKGREEDRFSGVYRLFKKGKGGDVAFLKKLCEIHFTIFPLPSSQMIIVDGGKSQIKSIENFITERKMPTLRVVGLVKDEHHHSDRLLFFSTQKKKWITISLTSLDSDLAIFLSYCQEEAHRRALASHAKWRKKSLFSA